MVTMFGWFKAASACASRVKRSANLASPTRSGARSLGAGSRFNVFWRALYTTPMPPRPRHSRMSSCGKCGAIWSGGSGACAAAVSSVNTVSVLRFNAIRQFGHSPAGAFSRSDAPHFGQTSNDLLLMPVTYRLAGDCYPAGSSLFPGQSGGQMAHLSLQVRPVGQRMRNLLSINFAKPLPQTMHGHASGCLIDLQPPSYCGIINGSPFSHEAAFENSE